MPLYEYVCDACGARFELIQKFSDPAPEQCPKCQQGPVHRQLSSPAIQFKGSGFYITDYAKKGSGSGESSPASKGETKSDTASSGGETKSDSGQTSASQGSDTSKAPKTATDK